MRHLGLASNGAKAATRRPAGHFVVRPFWAAASFAAVLGFGAVGITGCRSQTPVTAISDTGTDPADANMAPVQASDAEAAATGVPAGTVAQPIYTNAPAPAYSKSSAGRYAVPRTYAAPQNTAPQTTAPQTTANESQTAAQNYAQPGYGAGQQAPAPIERQEPAANQGYAQDPNQNNQGYQQDPNQGYQDPNQNYAQDPNQEYQGDAQALNNAIYSDVDPNEQAEQPPPPLPVYEQPPAPADNYLWTPGYWAYAPVGYYWVPGAWCAAPYVGALWTPGWWGPYNHHYGFHHGYWGRYVGFYGGVPYGFGYYGTGYHGGYWQGNNFAYNRAVTNVNITNIHNVYNRTVIVNNIRINNSVTNNYVNNVAIDRRASYNGGRGGIQARPVPSELAAFSTERHAPMPSQVANQRQAATNRGQFFTQNAGRPQLAVQSRPFAAERIAPPPMLRQPVRLPGVTPQQVAAGATIMQQSQQRTGQPVPRSNMRLSQQTQFNQQRLESGTPQQNAAAQQQNAAAQQQNALAQQRIAALTAADQQRTQIEQQQRSDSRARSSSSESRSRHSRRFSNAPTCSRRSRTSSASHRSSSIRHRSPSSSVARRPTSSSGWRRRAISSVSCSSRTSSARCRTRHSFRARSGSSCRWSSNASKCSSSVRKCSSSATSRASASRPYTVSGNRSPS